MLESFLLLDGGALTDTEIGWLEEVGTATAWLYEDLADPTARRMGPVLLPTSSAASDRATSALAATPERHWAVSWMHVDERHALLQHLRAIRYVLTMDSQRYFFRFADSRCMEAMIRATSPSRLQQLFGPIRRWGYLTRAGVEASWHQPNGGPASGLGSLRINDKELSALLDAIWPDQLLASALESDPELARHGSVGQRHAWIARLCDLMCHEPIDGYPEQLALTIRTLDSQGAILEPNVFPEAVQSIRLSLE